MRTMKKLFFAASCLVAMGMITTSCGSDDDVEDWGGDAANVDYMDANAKSWGNYMVNVASLLKKDATVLYDDWATSYNQQECEYEYSCRFHGAKIIILCEVMRRI